jgi:hypothetical protein
VIRLSFGNALKNFGVVEEALILALMLVFVFTVFYIPELDMTYRIGIAVLVIAVIFLSTMASVMLKAQKEARQEAARNA